MWHSKSIGHHLGLPQCSHLCPLLFKIFISSVFPIIILCCWLLFSNNVKTFFSILVIKNCVKLQNILDKFMNWCNIFGLLLNTIKCKVMYFYRSQKNMEYDYCSNVQLLERVNQVNDLGFLHVASLDFVRKLTLSLIKRYVFSTLLGDAFETLIIQNAFLYSTTLIYDTFRIRSYYMVSLLDY